MLIHTCIHTDAPSIYRGATLVSVRVTHAHTHTWPAYFIHERTFILDDVRRVDVCRGGRTKQAKKWKLLNKRLFKENLFKKQPIQHGYLSCVCVVYTRKKNQRKNNRKLDLHECYFRVYSSRCQRKVNIKCV